MRLETHDLHGIGAKRCEVYDLPPVAEDYWVAVTNVRCPVTGCDQTVVWYEAGFTPGYRVCMRAIDAEGFDPSSIRHRFQAKGDTQHPTLVRHSCREGKARGAE